MQSEEQRGKNECHREMWNTIQCTNICIMKVAERKGIEEGVGKIFKEIVFKTSQIYYFFSY